MCLGLMFSIPSLAQLPGQVKSVAATPSRCPSPVLTTLPRLRLLLASFQTDDRFKPLKSTADGQTLAESVAEHGTT